MMGEGDGISFVYGAWEGEPFAPYDRLLFALQVATVSIGRRGVLSNCCQSVEVPTGKTSHDSGNEGQRGCVNNGGVGGYRFEGG